MEYSHLFLAFIQVFGERLMTLFVLLYIKSFHIKKIRSMMDKFKHCKLRHVEGVCVWKAIC